jgi:hypothetical protein
MKTIQALALFGVALIAGCSEGPAATAPSGGAAVVAHAGFIGDRPYTWSLSCGGKVGIWAEWNWLANGVVISEGGGSASCSNSDKVSGTGVRPGSADEFRARVGGDLLGSTFDPSLPFSAQFKGAAEFCYLYHWQQIKCDKGWGLLTVDS